MIVPGRNARLAAVGSILAIVGLSAAIRMRGPADPAAIEAEARRALKERRWSRAEELLARIADRQPPVRKKGDNEKRGT